MNLKTLIIAFTLTFLCSYIALSQKNDQQNNSNFGKNDQQFNSNFKVNADTPELLSQFNNQSAQNKIFAVDKAVNQDEYIVGANDLFSLGLYGYVNQQIPMLVNVEGSVIIPTVGEIKIDRLTLRQAKEKVISEVKKRYYSSNVSFTLTTPKSFLVVVSSSTQKKIEVTSMNRVSDIVGIVYSDTTNISKMQYNKNNEREFFVSEISLRNIEITHKDKSVTYVDLYKYYSTNDDKYNPYLMEGDFVKIPYNLLDKNYITIYGAVQLSGVYEYNKSDDLESVIGLGRGFDNDAELDSILVYRLNNTTNKFENYTLSYNRDKKFKINLFDRVFVKYRTDFVKNFSVTVLGEVNMPGIYPISQKNVTLKEAIEMAGGFKKSAYLPLSIVFRQYDQEYLKKDTAEIILNMRTNDLIINEKDKLSFERDVISRRNRLVIDFEKLYNGNDSTQNIILEDKDVIYINDNKNIVYVYGQVMSEGYVQYKEGADFEYYVEKAGGYSLAADDGGTRIIRFNTRGWYKPNQTKILSGDFIYVPKESPTEFKEYLTIIATMISVVAAVITTYLLIKQQN